GTGTGTGTVVTFRDIASDVYAKEIEQAVALGFVAGFKEDNTFRPQTALTREQLVSMVLEALGKLPGANLQIPAKVSTRPYPDVDASRWSAAKIQWARENNIVSGYTDGNFRPTQAVTRAELMAVQRRAAQFALTLQSKPSNLSPKQPVVQFSDIQGHWAESLITEMSGYCRVASPFNETGTAFIPNDQARRNYAAAATLRMLNCVKP
ncbi:MAG TPA: S-layer protein, partial [Cyanobacteria bacterium UBA11149]|nr:S-layer protein [Cyanobacteria bacterium UBA11149]